MFLKKILNTTLMLLFSVLIGGFIAPSVNAQGLSLRVQPSTIDERADPGQSIEGVLTITNQNGGTQTYFISTRNVTGMQDTGTPIFETENATDPLEAASWIKPQFDSVTLEVNESMEIPYRIDIPENASPGSYFAAFFVTREADEATESGAGVGFHVASLVNLRVNGTVNDDMLFREFYVEKTLFTEPSILFKSKVDNTGTIHQRPRGIIAIKDMFGNDVGQVTFNDTLGAILPKNSRIFDIVWDYDGFAFGKYTAEASLVFGDTQKKTITREVHFWIVPIKELGIVFGGIVLFLLVLLLSIRKYVQHVLKKAGHKGTSTVSKKHVSLAKKMARTLVWLIFIILFLFIVLIVFYS